jgi:hypothetical protein
MEGWVGRLGIVNEAAGVAVEFEDRNCFVAEKISLHFHRLERGGAVREEIYPVLGKRALMKSCDGFDVFPSGSDDQARCSGPPGVSEALNAGLGGRDEIHGWEVGVAESEALQALLREHESDCFGMGNGSVTVDDKIDPRGDEASVFPFKDRGRNGAAGLLLDVPSRERDDETHLLLASRKMGGVFLDKGREPGWEVEGNLVGVRHERWEMRAWWEHQSPFFTLFCPLLE